ncbi:MAG: pantetheine-phosphate adenylyltransferase, partial [Culicoidibacterales bacterium]
MNDKTNTIAIYSGSFDPMTNGHIDIVERSAKIFKQLHIVVLNNPKKQYLFTSTQRKQMIAEAVAHLPNVLVTTYDGLVVEAAKALNACVIIRGLRAITDFEYEMQMASANKMLNPDIETFLLMTSNEFSFLSSTVVKEIATFKGNISRLVPKHVQKAVEAK